MPDDQAAVDDGANDDVTATDDGSTTDDSTSDGASDGLKKALNAERKQRRDLEKRARDLEAKVKEFDDRDKSEAERASEARANAERERDEAKAEVMQIRREGWLTKAAVDAKFIDPDDAVALLSREEIDDASDAKKAIADLAKAKPHLVGVREPSAGSFGGGQRAGGDGGDNGSGEMNAWMRKLRQS